MSNSALKPKAMIAAGGTGGHIFPALAVAKALIACGWEVQWIGTAERLEAKVVPNHKIPISFLPIKGMRGKGLSAKLNGFWGVLRSIFNALHVLRQHKSNIVLGFGGYPSFPAGIAAKLTGRPLIIHEQNALPGLTNKLLGRVANKVFLAFADAKPFFSYKQSDVKVVGNPVRKDIVKIKDKKHQGPFRLLIVGGSLGAKPLNEIVPQVLLNMNLNAHDVIVKHQCGADNQISTEQAYQSSTFEVNVTAFIDDIASTYQWADAVICRAGALTVSEVAEAGLAACFVPLPHAVDDHQTKNALFLASQQAAELIAQSQLQHGLRGVLTRWLANPQFCYEMGDRAAKCFPKDATEQLVEACQLLLNSSAEKHASKSAGVK